MTRDEWLDAKPPAICNFILGRIKFEFSHIFYYYLGTQNRYLDEIGSWCAENCNGVYCADVMGFVVFADPQDALLYQLTYGERAFEDDA